MGCTLKKPDGLPLVVMWTLRGLSTVVAWAVNELSSVNTWALSRLTFCRYLRLYWAFFSCTWAVTGLPSSLFCSLRGLVKGYHHSLFGPLVGCLSVVVRAVNGFPAFVLWAV
jgi:hypothetical protein